MFFIFILLFTTNLAVFGAEQSTRDVGFINRYMVNTDGRSFEIVIGANFLVSSFTFSANDKMLKFNIETGLEKENIAEVTIPRDLIDGEFTVLLDNEEISYILSNTAKTSVISMTFD